MEDTAAWLTAARAVAIMEITFTMNNPEESEDLTTYTTNHAIDVVGVLDNDDVVGYDDSGEEVTPRYAMDGWHVNYLGDLPEGWESFELTLKHP